MRGGRATRQRHAIVVTTAVFLCRRRSHQWRSNGSSGQGRDGAQRQWAAAAEVALHRTEVATEAAASYYSFCSCRRQQWVLFDAHGLLWRSREAAAAVVERSAPRPLTATRFACIGEGGEFDLSQGGRGCCAAWSCQRQQWSRPRPLLLLPYLRVLIAPVSARFDRVGGNSGLFLLACICC